MLWWSGQEGWGGGHMGAGRVSVGGGILRPEVLATEAWNLKIAQSS